MPRVREQRRGPVRRVLLADAAEVDFHAGPRQAHPAGSGADRRAGRGRGGRADSARRGGRCGRRDAGRAALDPTPTDQVERRRERVALRQSRRHAPEVPCMPQHARGEVERSRRELMAAVRIIEQRVRLGVDRHRRPARRAIDRRRDAVVAVARILGFDAGDLGDRGVGGVAGGVRIGRDDRQRTGRRHRAERKAVQRHPRILARRRARRARTPGRRLPAPGLQNALATPAWIQLAENGSRPGLPSPPSFHALFCR